MTDQSKPPAPPPVDLKDLLGAIASQQRVMLAVSVSLLFFVLAPRSDKLLRDGKDELAQLTEGTNEHPNQIQQAIKTLQKEEAALERIQKGFPGSKVTHKPEDLKKSAQALGIRSPATVGQILDALDAKPRYCAPVVEAGVFQGIRLLEDSEKPDIVVGGLVALTSADSLAAARAVLEQAMVFQRKSLAATSAMERADLPATQASEGTPPQQFIPDGNGGMKANPRWNDYQRAQDAKKKAKSAKDNATDAKSEADDAKTELLAKLEALARSVIADPGASSEPPPYIAVEVSFVGKRNVYVPMVCARTALFDEPWAKGALPNLQLTPEWEKVRDRPPAAAAKIVDIALLKGEQNLDVGGVKVPERLLTQLGPVVLSALLLWHLVHLFRLRSLVKDGEVAAKLRDLARVNPTVPSRSNWPLPLATAVATIAIALSLGVRLTREQPLELAAVALCMLLGVAMIVASLLFSTSSASDRS